LCKAEDFGPDGQPKKTGACLTAAEDAAWQPITNWRQVDPSFPDQSIGLYGPGTASGTFDYFTEAIVGKAKASRTDYTPSEDDNVLVQGITSDRGGLGYFGMSYYTANKTRVRALAVSYKGGPAVYPTAETVQSGQYRPLARPLFIYVSAEALDKPPVAAFVNFYLENAPALAAHVGFVPLSARAYDIGKDRVARRMTGTAFGGVQDVAGDIEEVLSRPLLDAPPDPSRSDAQSATPTKSL
jgi:phosphate transport system substrate-binding protein